MYKIDVICARKSFCLPKQLLILNESVTLMENFNKNPRKEDYVYELIRQHGYF